MKQLLMILSLITLSAYTQANCVQSLTNNYQVDGQTFTLNTDDLDRDYGNDKQGQAIALIKHTMSNMGCTRAEINFGKGPWGRGKTRCQQIVYKQPASTVCYIESNLGYFIVSWDMLTGAYLTFNRWD